MILRRCRTAELLAGITLPSRPQMVTLDCVIHHLEGVAIPRRLQTLPLHLPLFLTVFHQEPPGPNSGVDAGNSRFEPTDKRPRCEGWDLRQGPGSIRASPEPGARSSDAKYGHCTHDQVPCPAAHSTGRAVTCCRTSLHDSEDGTALFNSRRMRSFLLLAQGEPPLSTQGRLQITVQYSRCDVLD